MHDHGDDLELHASECSDSSTTSSITRKRRLVLFPCPYLQGHINPMLQLATLLHSKGFSITIIHTRFNAPNPSDYPHFHFAPISSSSPDSDIVDQFHLQHSTSDIIAFVSAINVKFVNPFRDCLIHLLSSSSNEANNNGDTIACVITDALMHFTQDVANNLHIPRIVLRTSSPTSFVAFAAYPLLLQMGYLPIQALDTIRRDFTRVPIFPIGPFHKWSSSSILTEDRSCISWLDEQAPKSVIYTAWGLVNSGHPFLWVVRPGLIEHLLPDGFQEMIRSTGCLVKWAPQEQVLAHPAVGGFWTHNGWNSTLESVCEGVPMLCRPCFTDQSGECKICKGDVEKAVKRLMTDADIDGDETMMESVRDLKQKAANCLKKGGSSYESIEKLTDLIMSF
ncbi:hypothetical protein MKW92_019655 [Papaver armeniacum]|nr:hypothetical protein MKW92_019655 [Papaver armeniacum]